jgi:hypothetical protein
MTSQTNTPDEPGRKTEEINMTFGEKLKSARKEA